MKKTVSYMKVCAVSFMTNYCGGFFVLGANTAQDSTEIKISLFVINIGKKE